MTKISQLSDIGGSLAAGDEFVIRDVSDISTPNKKVTASGFIDYVIAQGVGSGFTQISAGATAPASVRCFSSGTTREVIVTTSGVERARFTTAGQLRMAGAGITFNGDTATANELDDYEEGTFTFTVNAGGSNVVSTGGTFTGYYTKVGNLVTLQSGTIEINAKSAATGALTITGLPFTSAQQTAVPLCGLFSFSFADYPSARIQAGTAVIDLYETANSGTRTTLTDADILTTVSTVFFVWSTSYRV